MVIVFGNGDTSSNPGRFWLHFTKHLYSWLWIFLYSLQLWVNSRTDWILHPWLGLQGRSSRLHPVSAQSCGMSVRAGRPAFPRPCEGVHRTTSLTSSSLLLQQCPACLVCLILIVFVMGGRWPLDHVYFIYFILFFPEANIYWIFTSYQ